MSYQSFIGTDRADDRLLRVVAVVEAVHQARAQAVRTRRRAARSRRASARARAETEELRATYALELARLRAQLQALRQGGGAAALG